MSRKRIITTDDGPATVPAVVPRRAEMNTTLVRGREARSTLPAPLTLAAGRSHTAETILRAWFEGKSAHTIRNYRHDLADFALYFSRALGISPPMDVATALGRLFRQSSPSAHEIVLGFRQYLGSAHLAAASINRHIAALRSVTKLGRMLGMMTWHIEVSGVKPEKRRATAGPTVADVRRLLAATRGDSEAETRDYAIVLTFYCLGLRVSELCGLTIQETDLESGVTWILGKGRREKELVPLPAPVIEAIHRYLRHRGTAPGPLFQTRGTRGRHRNGALETRSLLKIVRSLGQRIGLHVWCHALRHTSITQAAVLGQRAGLGLDKIRAFSRHRSIMTLQTYLDEHDITSVRRTLTDLIARTMSDETNDGGAR
jgi:integrase/recombinase XerC